MKLAPTSHVLDLGSASGGNSLLMQNLGLKVSSLEYSQLGYELQLRKGIDVTKGDARDIPFPSDYFDALICLDVLEHIQEDDRVVSEIQRVLKPGGKFLISVPEDPSLWSDHDVAVSHFRRYRKSEIKSVILKEPRLFIDSTWSSNYIIKPMVKIFRKFAKGSSLKETSRLENFLLLSIDRIEVILNLSNVSGMTAWIAGRKLANEEE
jgi:SAM-dependent methyltransferase